MIKTNIDTIRKALENRSETDTVYIDGSTDGAMFRTIVEYQSVDNFASFVEDDLDVSITRKKNIGFGVEVTIE